MPRVRKETKLGLRLQQLREESGWSAAQVADKMTEFLPGGRTVSRNTILDIEVGKILTPSEPVLRALAEVYEESYESLRSLLPKEAVPSEGGLFGKNPREIKQTALTKINLIIEKINMLKDQLQ